MLIGLTTGFGNWGKSKERFLFSLQMIVDTVSKGLETMSDDPTFLNLAGVAMAQSIDDLDYDGYHDQGDMVRTHPQLGPEALFRKAGRLDPTFVAPLYHLGRWTHRKGELRQATELIAAARRRLLDHGAESMARPTMYYPVWTENAASSDRLLAIFHNTTRFEYREDAARRERQANLLRWRIEETLGDLAVKASQDGVALRHYIDAGKAAPDICTEAMRKIVKIVEKRDRPDILVPALEHIARINPMDLPYREMLDAEYQKQGRTDAALREEIRLLKKAVPTPKAFERPPIDEL